MNIEINQIVSANIVGTTIQGRIGAITPNCVFIENQPIAYSSLSTATPEQIQIVIDEENRTLAMLLQGDRLMNILSKCEAMAEQEGA